MSDFQQKAAAACQRLAASSLTPDEEMAQALAQDRPTIDAAIKSYLSLISARSMTQPFSGEKCAMSSEEALACCRVFLKTINQYTFALDKEDESSSERRVVAQLWNGLVASNQKSTKFLGRRALKWAYDDLDLKLPEEIDEEKRKLFVEEFRALLQYSPDETSQEDHDGALLWDVDGGKEELARRRQRRADRAAEQQEEEKTPVIEELDDSTDSKEPEEN